MGRVAYRSDRLEEFLGREERTWWAQNVDRLRKSKHVAVDVVSGEKISESEHLFLGFEPAQNFPILLHQRTLNEHAHIVGRTGSGKTSIGMMQLLIQLVRGHRLPPPAETVQGRAQEWSGKVPVVIIDLKGDETMFQTAKEEAERRGQKFRAFTLEKGKQTSRFNPFFGFQSELRTLPQLVQLVLDSLGLNHGDGYGRGYFSHRSRYMLSQILESNPDVFSFAELYRLLHERYREHKAEFRDAFELVSVIESLTHYPQLVSTRAESTNGQANIIQMDRVLEEDEVVYFWMPSALESVSVREVGKLVLFNLCTAANNRKAAGKELKRMYLFIDECQKLVGENFQQVLQQARSGGISVILANQSLSDLKTPGFDLRSTITVNTRVKMYFSTSEVDEIKMISYLSGEELQLHTDGEPEVFRPRLSALEILGISDHPLRLLLHVNGGSGYTQFGGVPVPVQSDWPISKREADERARRPWPTFPEAPGEKEKDAALGSKSKKARPASKKDYDQLVTEFLDS